MARAVWVMLVLAVFLAACSGKTVEQSALNAITGSVVIDTTAEEAPDAQEAVAETTGMDSSAKCDIYRQKLNEYNAINDDLNNKKKEMVAKLDSLDTVTDEGQKKALEEAVDRLFTEINAIKPQLKLIQKQVDSMKAECES